MQWCLFLASRTRITLQSSLLSYTITKSVMMGIGPIFALALLALCGVALADKKSCIKGKYEKSLGQAFKDCYNSKQSLEIPRMKQCWTDLMKPDVVKVAANGQMTVDYTNFGNYGPRNSNDVGRAMTACHQGKTKQDDMYKEAARASQCVFDKLKKNC